MEGMEGKNWWYSSKHDEQIVHRVDALRKESPFIARVVVCYGQDVTELVT